MTHGRGASLADVAPLMTVMMISTGNNTHRETDVDGQSRAVGCPMLTLYADVTLWKRHFTCPLAMG